MSRRRRLLGLVVLVAGVLLAPIPPPASASACMPGPPTRVVDPVAPVADLPLGQQETRIHWTKFHRKIVVGTASTLEGQVVTEEGAIGGADVDLYARAATSQAWTHVASATTDSERGVFAFGCLEPVRTTLYRVVHEATPFHARSSGDKQVAVARRLPDSLERVRANRFSFRGTVLPRDAGLSVQLERRTCRTCAWRTVERTTTDRRARWGFRIDVSRLEGSRWYRATAPGDQRNARGHSDRVWRFTR